jgi:NAD(P)-dependent dehydrogenase (short-subunit alcohol dehydrogenase family)
MGDWLDLSAKAVFVAGAGGLGAEVVNGFLKVGARVAVVDIDEKRLKTLRESMAGVDELHAFVADLSAAEPCREAVAEAAKHLGGIDVFVHAVGMNSRDMVLDSSDEAWNTVLTVNLSSAFWLGRAVGRIMCDVGRGRMVFISSVSGLLAHPGHAAYAASKAGLNQLMRVMAREWAPSGIAVNAVAPGYTETNLTRAYLDRPGMRAELTGLVPAGRLGAADEVVGPILFLASSQASFVTGQVIYVDGGRTLV